MTPPRALSQLTLNLEPSLAERWDTLREFVAHRTKEGPKLQKTVAADMDMSPSLLSKKFIQEDSNRFTCDDLEAWIASTGDVQSVIEYLAAKYAAGGDEARKARALSRLETLAATLEREIVNLQDGR